MPKTTCPEHRRQGYAYAEGRLICRGCGLPESAHETSAETVARNAAAAEAEVELLRGATR